MEPLATTPLKVNVEVLDIQAKPAVNIARFACMKIIITVNAWEVTVQVEVVQVLDCTSNVEGLVGMDRHVALHVQRVAIRMIITGSVCQHIRTL